MMADIRQILYPEIEPYQKGFLRVSELHSVYYEECGKADGNPVVVLHGGPGSGTSPRDRRFSDPEQYHVILLHQRGAGKSTPPAEMKENTTWDLVEDLERLRNHLHINQWVVYGGSWGGCLALVYAITHPDRVKALIVFGPVLGLRSEIEWMYSDSGASLVYPGRWEDFSKDIPEAERHDIILAYQKRLFGPDPEIQAKYAKSWNIAEMSIINLKPNPEIIHKCHTDPLWNLQHALTECHYLINNYFLPSEEWILDNLEKIRHIPGTLLHGRYDMAIPCNNSWQIHKRWPEVELNIIPACGHSSLDPPMEACLLAATEKYKHL